MTIGTGTYSPQPRFVFTKSYVTDVYFATYTGETFVRSGDTFTVYAVPPDPTFLFMRLYDGFFTWNSNQYTLDFVVQEAWYKLGGVGGEIPINFSVKWSAVNPSHGCALLIDWAPLTPVYHRVPMPAAPPNWWMPKPLP